MTTPDPIAEIRASFFVECEELLEALLDGLIGLDSGDADDETVNTCFRAVHSMKGGASAFGLDDLVRFSHRYESVLDEVRAGRLAPGHDVVMLFTRAADVLSDIVRLSREGTPIDPDAVEPTLQELERLIPDAESDDDEGVTEFRPTALAMPLLETTGRKAFRIRFRPAAQLFLSGNEPVHLLRALSELGDVRVTPDLAAVPELGQLDPGSACLSWEIVIETSRDRADLEEIFEFVEGLCTLAISEEPGDVSTMTDRPALSDLPGLRALSGAVPATGPDRSVTEIGSRLTLSLPAATAQPATGRATDVHSEVAAPPHPAQPVNARPAQGNPATAAAMATVRVDLDRIERLVNLVGELVINQAMLCQSATQAGVPSSSPIAQGLDEFMRLTRDIQESVMMIRAQPVKPLFQRLARVVRDTSASLGKPVRLVSRGETTEIDKTVIERLADPLTHLIRNAVDHGIEAPAARMAAGKPAEGSITLSAAHRSGRVVVEITDDGGGIDRARVRSIAEERGLIAPGLEMSEAEIDALLFLPGFTTVREVSSLSGRGVGMDVVRKSIHGLGGRVSISSTPGTGTSFSISLPLTLAVLDGMIVDVAGESLVVPIAAIAETMAFREGDIHPVGPGTQVLQIRDRFVPLLDLGAELGFRPPGQPQDGSVVLLVAQEGETLGAIIVDAIQEQRQVVIKGLQQGYSHAPGIAAATILGDGQVALILDPSDMLAGAGSRPGPSTLPLDPTG